MLGTTEETRKMLEDVERQNIDLNREEEKFYCNNPLDSNKSICSSAVTDHLKTTKLTKYLHTSCDIITSISKKHNLVDIDKLIKGLTVEKARSILKSYTSKQNINVKGYCITVEDHAMFLDKEGKTIVDTNEQESEDNRIIIQCNMII